MKRTYYWMSPEEIKENKTEYFIQTVEEYNSLAEAIRKDDGWFELFISLCEHYYKSEPCGGRLHIVLDDGNLENDHLSWCAGLANGCQDHEAMDLANLMRLMTLEQRMKVYESYPYESKAREKAQQITPGSTAPQVSPAAAQTAGQ